MTRNRWRGVDVARFWQCAVLISGLLACSSSEAVAQVCAGAAPLLGGAGAIGASLALGSTQQGFGATVGGGTDSFFGAADFTTVGFDGIPGRLVGLGGTLGSDNVLGSSASGSAHVCPFATGGFSWGPDTSALTVQTGHLGAGLSLGGAIDGTDRLSVIPTATLGLFFEKASFIAARSTIDRTALFGVVSFGVGFVLDHQITILPQIVVPLGVEGGQTSFVLGVSYTVPFQRGVVTTKPIPRIEPSVEPLPRVEPTAPPIRRIETPARKFRIFITAAPPTVDEKGFVVPDSTNGLNDSATDLRRGNLGSTYDLVTARDGADLVLTVVSRDTNVQRIRSVDAELSIAGETAHTFRGSTANSWNGCADRITDQVKAWVRANRVAIDALLVQPKP